MTSTTTPPTPGGDFAFDTAVRAFTDQMRWIDALDTKAGVLMAADAVLAGLVLTRGSLLLDAPAWVGVLVALLLFVSFVLALLSFSTRRFGIAPDVSALASEAATTAPSSLRWTALSDIVDALEMNEPKVGHKADLLFASGIGLMLAIASFGGYFISQIFPGS
jgi:hypothetical protein